MAQKRSNEESHIQEGTNYEDTRSILHWNYHLLFYYYHSDNQGGFDVGGR